MIFGVLVSGSGSNLAAILEAVKAGAIAGRVGVVISNVAGVLALERARAAGVPTLVIDHRAHAGRAAFDAALVDALRTHEVECVVLAGFMRIVTNVLLDAFPDRVVNVHPALLPAFPGVHGAKQAIDYGVRVAGCTVHFVDAGTDTGPIIAQRAIDVRELDDEVTLAARILREEHAVLPEVLAAIAEGRVRVVRGAGRPRVTYTVAREDAR